MKGALAACLLLGVFVASIAEVGVSAAGRPDRATLQVGMWTLWHDREADLRPIKGVAVKMCERCPTRLLTKHVTIRAVGNTVMLGGEGGKAKSKSLWLTGTITLKAHGETQTLQSPALITAKEGALIFAVTLPVESYVERVVASESGPADSAESLKALAIVIRTFALHETHGHADYDVCDSTHCQLLHWSGNSARQPAAHSATLATAGETLWFHGQRALAYFGKDCGGRTASPAEIWPNARPSPYLPSLPDRYCTNNGSAEWNTQLTRAQLTAVLAEHGLARPVWKTLTVARRGESGRAVTVKLDGREVSAEEFRLAVGEALGWNWIPSTWFEVSQRGDQFNFHGRGWGHGVGLCQKGAAAMALEKRTVSEILVHYFPGAAAADEASGRVWRSFSGDGIVLESLNDADIAYLPALVRARQEASERSGLVRNEPFVVRAFASTTAFRDGTLEPGWIAAFTEGHWIATQPLHTLAARHLLDETMRHEFLHVFVESEAVPNTPLWLREGLVEAWSDSGNGKSDRAPALTIEAVDGALRTATNEKGSLAAHCAAGWYAERLLHDYGRGRVIAWLRSGVPANVVIHLGQRQTD